MNLQQLNQLTPLQLKEELSKCCGAPGWIKKMTGVFPVETKEALVEKAEAIWNVLEDKDWLEAFAHHPKIGDIDSVKKKFANTTQWASAEQALVQQTNEETLEALAAGNAIYEARFGYIFIICATGKTAEEMLHLLQSRLANSAGEEIKIAAAEQLKITKIRLEKLLA